MNRIVTGIYIYPIKSLAGISCVKAKVQEMGFENDRRWMLIDEKNQFVTQRKNAILSQFRPEIIANKIIVRYLNEAQEFLMNECLSEVIFSKVWDDEAIVFEVNPLVSKWFSRHLGFECKLVKIQQIGDRTHYSSQQKETFNVSLADGYPYLLAGSASLDFLNEKLETKISMNRFRPNIVIATTLPHEEDDFTHFSIGNIVFKNAKPCGRCVMINNDPETGETHKEPLKTLSTYRNFDNSVYFGTNVVVLNFGEIALGDWVRIDHEVQNLE